MTMKSQHIFAICLALQIPAPVSLLGQSSGGTLIRELQEIRQVADASAQSVNQLEGHPAVGEGRQRAAKLDELLAGEDYSGAAEAYEKDLADGFGVDFHRQNRELAERNAERSLKTYERLLRQAARSRGSNGETGASGSQTQLANEIINSLDLNEGEKSLARKRIVAIRDRVGRADQEFLRRYPQAALAFAETDGDIPPELVNKMMESVLRTYWRSYEIAARCRRAEAFYSAFPEILREQVESNESEGPGRSEDSGETLF